MITTSKILLPLLVLVTVVAATGSVYACGVAVKLIVLPAIILVYSKQFAPYKNVEMHNTCTVHILLSNNF